MQPYKVACNRKLCEKFIRIDSIALKKITDDITHQKMLWIQNLQIKVLDGATLSLFPVPKRSENQIIVIVHISCRYSITQFLIYFYLTCLFKQKSCLKQKDLNSKD